MEATNEDENVIEASYTNDHADDSAVVDPANNLKVEAIFTEQEVASTLACVLKLCFRLIYVFI